MLKIICVWIVLILSSVTYAITPQQYCTNLEAKKRNSFELLNAETLAVPSDRLISATTVITAWKVCYKGRFCYGPSIRAIKQAVDEFTGVSGNGYEAHSRTSFSWGINNMPIAITCN